MDTEKCKVLLRSVDTGSFTKAAEELGYTPSGVTHMMNALEEDLGVTLLRRTRSGVSLTSAGHDLIGSIRELVAAADKLDQNVAELKGMTVGHVAFASFPTSWRGLRSAIRTSRWRSWKPAAAICAKRSRSIASPWVS